MSPKDDHNHPKTRLLDDLKSIKGTLDEDDDNIPLLGDEDDIPVLANEEDVPVLSEVDDNSDARDKASLQAALRELESLELSPKASRARATVEAEKPIPSLEDKIRASAAPPLVKIDEKPEKENPFLAKKPRDKIEESRKQSDAALQSVIAQSRSMSGKTSGTPKKEPEKAAALTIKDDPSATPVDFKPTPKPATAKTESAKTAAKSSATPAPEPDDAADEILKMLGEPKPVIKKGGSQTDNNLEGSELEGAFDALADIDIDNLGQMSTEELDLLIDEVVEECSAAFNALLEKKLREKLSRLLKK